MLVRSYLESASVEEKAAMVDAVGALVQNGTLTSFVLVITLYFCVLHSSIFIARFAVRLFVFFSEWLF